jgi:tripartite-type tricarboxylate transporter receptor subunit TctC
MTIASNRSVIIACALCLWTAGMASAYGQTHYPTRPVRLVVPFAPGGGSDIVARYIATRLSERLGQPVVVDNRPAASGIVGADLVAKAAPDGHTLLTTTVTFVINSSLQKGLPYDALRDFAPITIVISSPVGLLLHPSVPAKTVKEFVAHARSIPGKLNFGSSGPGSAIHLMTERFSSMAGVRMNHVPYKGVAAYTAAQLANEIQVSMGNLFSTAGHWKAGRLRAIAHGGTKRAESFPDIPTIAESGVPGYEASLWYGFMAPGRTPRPIVNRLHKDMAAIALAPESRQTFVAQGNEIIANTPEAFAKTVRAEFESWGKIGRQLGITLN